mgnify:CR=1 FL=1
MKKENDEITFKYSRYGKTYTAFPYKIIFHNGFWYLAAENDGILNYVIKMSRFFLEKLTELYNK